MSGRDVVQERIDAQIRAGRHPSPGVLEDLLGPDRARLGPLGTRRAAATLAEELVGLGPLSDLVADPATTDVLVNGDGQVWADRGEGLTAATDHALAGAAAVERLAVRLAGLAGRRLDAAQPWVDGFLPEGVRLHAVLPPIAHGGAHISLRVPRRRAFGLAELTENGMVDQAQADLLRALVADRVALLVSGGTGSGKTTLLAALLAEVPAHERIITVEDVLELRLAHPHLVQLQCRPANVEGAGAVGMADLVRQALRMRPDRLVVGEVRGAEVRELLMALNTGHEGGCGTVHANSAGDVIARLDGRPW